jgi:uncharacterized pyridoxamine 5'-phosphate oxidase family protein
MSKNQEALDFLSGKVFYLATVDGNQPKVRPFGFVAEYEEKLYFVTNQSKPSYKQLKAQPFFEISAASADGAQWVRISGKAVFDERPELKEFAFKVNPHLKDLYGAPDSPVLAPFYLSEGVAVFQSMAGESKTVKL